MLEQIQIRRAELNSRLLRAKSDEAWQEENIKRLEEEFLQINENISALNDKQTLLEEELNQIRDELSGKDQKLRDTQVLYHQDKSRLDALSNLTERYEGYGGSVKRVMEQKENSPGIIGVVADLIKVDKKYEVAIETALGGSIQNIVTENEETAKEMIAFLKQNKAGRATFLPLTSINGSQNFSQPAALKEKASWDWPMTWSRWTDSIRGWPGIFWGGLWWWIPLITPLPLQGSTGTACASSPWRASF